MISCSLRERGMVFLRKTRHNGLTHTHFVGRVRPDAVLPLLGVGGKTANGKTKSCRRAAQ